MKKSTQKKTSRIGFSKFFVKYNVLQLCKTKKVIEWTSLLAPQSGALRISAYGDFHPIHPSIHPTHPTNCTMVLHPSEITLMEMIMCKTNQVQLGSRESRIEAGIRRKNRATKPPTRHR